MKINVSDYLEGNRICSHFITGSSEKTSSYENDKIYDLNLGNASDCGIYYHSGIEHQLDRNIPFDYKDTPVNIDINKAVSWLYDNIGLGNYTVEQDISVTVKMNNGEDLTITGRPDAYIITDSNMLTIIDFKYSDTRYPNFLIQLVLYAYILSERYENIKFFRLIVRLKDSAFERIFEKDKILNMAEDYINDIKESAESTGFTPCQYCHKCKECKTCKAVFDEVVRLGNICLNGCPTETESNSFFYFENIIHKRTCDREKLLRANAPRIPKFESNDVTNNIYEFACELAGEEPQFTYKKTCSSKDVRRVCKEAGCEGLFQKCCTGTQTPSITELLIAGIDWHEYYKGKEE